jgi:hypothetical protein
MTAITVRSSIKENPLILLLGSVVTVSSLSHLTLISLLQYFAGYDPVASRDPRGIQIAALI